MTWKLKLALVSGAVACALAFMAAFWFLLIDGSGSCESRTVYSTDGKFREWVTWDMTNSGLRVYGQEDGTIDLDRSGHFKYGYRWSGLSQHEIKDLSTGEHRVGGDLWTLLGAVDTYMSRIDDLPDDTVLRATAFAKRFRAPSSLAEAIAYPPAKALLHGSEVPYRDPWGREYQLKVTPDPLAPFQDGVTVTIYTRGSDGLPGGEGDAADVGIESNWGGTQRVNSIP